MFKISARLIPGLRSRLAPRLLRLPLRPASTSEGSRPDDPDSLADRLRGLIWFAKKNSKGSSKKGSSQKPTGSQGGSSGSSKKTPEEQEREKRDAELLEEITKMHDDMMKSMQDMLKRMSEPRSSKGPEESASRHRARDFQYLTFLYFVASAVLLSIFTPAIMENFVVADISYEKFLNLLRAKQIEVVEVVTDTQGIRKTHHLIVKAKKPVGTTQTEQPAPQKTPPPDHQNQPQTKTAYLEKLMKEREEKWEYTVIHSGGLLRLKVFDIDNFLANLEKEQLAAGYDSQHFIPVKFSNKVDPFKVIPKILTDSLIFGVGIYILYSVKNLKVLLDRVNPSRTSKAIKTFEVKKLQGGFGSVAGLDNPKLEIQEFVDFLKNPFIYGSVGARMPKGALLTGPPGTGKTLLAKACAVESQVSFFAVSGSDFVEKYVGIGSQNVRKLFQEAKLRAPSVIFIDEIDAIGKKRHESAMFTNTERENTLNQLLVELDGFDSNTSVVVLAATNRPEILDPALRRPGRLDRHIALTLPDIRARESIFRLYLAKLKIETDDMDYLSKRLASLTPQFSGADISNLCNEAAILAAREETEKIQLRHFEEAAERVIAGLRRDNLVSREERVLVATHESGHAVASWFLKGADPLVKVTIVPRSKGALGYAQYLTPDDDIHTKSALLDRITFILGGRVAEEIFFGKISTGAQDDLEKAFKLAHALVTRLGMTEDFGYSNFSEDENRNQYMPTKENLKFSDRTQSRIDELIIEIIQDCHTRCTQLLTEKKGLIEQLRDGLLEKESLTEADLIAVLGQRPVPPEGTMGFRLHSENQSN